MNKDNFYLEKPETLKGLHEAFLDLSNEIWLDLTLQVSFESLLLPEETAIIPTNLNSNEHNSDCESPT